METLFVEPFSPDYYGDRLFDPDSPLNRDDCLAPFRLLRQVLGARGVTVRTADALWRDDRLPPGGSSLVSLGMVKHLGRAARRPGVVPLALFLFEPPTVAPRRFLFLRHYQRRVRHVFTLVAPDERFGPLSIGGRQFRFPQGSGHPVGSPSAGARDGWLVAIFANKRAALPYHELYSARRRALEFFGRHGELDLFGPGWDRRIVSGASRSRGIAGAWRGLAVDKHATLHRYRFALCYENSRWRGYVTEKIFDCLHAGTIPIYWGAPDIQEVVPPEAFIDRRAFTSEAELRQFLHDLPGAAADAYRNAGRDFLHSDAYRRFAPEAFVQLILDLLAG